MVRAFSLALGQMWDPRMRRVLLLGIALSLVLFGVFYAGVWGLIGLWAPDTLTLPWDIQIGWFATFLRWFAGAFIVVLAMFLMVPLATTLISLFLDDVAQAVEDRHYPRLPPAKGLSIGQGLREALQFFVLMVVVNVALLVLFFTLPPLYPFAFYLGNGWLLGREYFSVAALRRMDRDSAKALMRTHAGQIWLAGIVLALPLSIPVLNLLVPVVGAATFTHIYHRATGQTPAP